jgi:hypothetical protein
MLGEQRSFDFIRAAKLRSCRNTATSVSPNIRLFTNAPRQQLVACIPD